MFRFAEGDVFEVRIIHYHLQADYDVEEAKEQGGYSNIKTYQEYQYAHSAFHPQHHFD